MKFEVETFLEKTADRNVISWSLDQKRRICDYCLLSAQILQEGAIQGQINSWEDRKCSIREGLPFQKIKIQGG